MITILKYLAHTTAQTNLFLTTQADPPPYYFEQGSRSMYEEIEHIISIQDIKFYAIVPVLSWSQLTISA